MSSNRLMYDDCSYNKSLKESVGPLSYLLNPMKYENCNKCRNELGLVGGTNVSNIRGNLVDLENDLFGITRLASDCPSNKYHPSTNNQIVTNDRCGRQRVIDTRMQHLPSCQMINYRAVRQPSPMDVQSCPSPILSNINVCN